MRVFEHVASLALAGGLWALGSLTAAPLALAQASTGTALTGVWRAGSTQYDVAIESWGEDCGPRPQSSRTAGGGIVNIDQSGGQLVIHGRGQDIRSDACWSRNPAIKRQSATFANSTWSTKCKTSANDPREEQGTYTLRITGPDTLQYQDVSRYNWALNQSRCVATFTTIQTLTRRNTKADQLASVAEQAKPVPAVVSKPELIQPPPEPEDKDDDKACTPGAPHRLALRPRSAEIEVGQRVCFRPRVTDQAGCVIRDPSVSWKLTHSKALRGTLKDGCFTAADTAAEAEGEFKVLASAGSLRGEATVSVHPVDLSALIAKRIGGGALTGFEESAPLPAAPKSVTRVATRHDAEQASNSPRKVIGIALGVAATALALAALWLSRRKLPTAVPVTGPSSVPSSIPPPLPPRGPAAHTRAEVVSASPIASPPPAAVTRIADVAPAPPVPISSAPPPSNSEPWICPKCRVGYPAHQQTCPKDGTTLMPYAEFARSRKRSEEERKKRCPRCGSMFPAHASFCAEDGTPLVDA